MYDHIIGGAIAGLGYSLLGYGKNLKEKEESFDWTKFGKSIVICTVVGGVTGYTGADFNAALTGSMGIAITSVVNNAVRFVKTFLEKKGVKLKKKK